ncbi:MAG TPA: hypothetical protein VFP43_20850 [Mesorhizobium sp.]|nr:hypothetical protein [Mesorhizobium sp.]
MTQSRVNPTLDFRPDGLGTRITNALKKNDLPGDVLGDRGAYMRDGDLNIKSNNLARGARPLPRENSIAKNLLLMAEGHYANSITDAYKEGGRNNAGPLLMPGENERMLKSGYNSHVGPMAPPINVTEEAVNLPVDPPAPDDRTLIDKLHAATFGNDVGLQWIADKYALRMVLRKAHCFTLDTVTSSLVGDFSMAIATDLESARRMAIPPFPITWIDIDNRARLARMKELGVGLTATASGESEAGPVVPRVGWLIHPDHVNGGHFATYVCETDQGVTMAPLSYWWHTDESAAMSPSLRGITKDVDIDFMDRLSFGLKNSGVSPTDAVPSPTPMHIKLMSEQAKYPPQVRELMIEIGGELRHVWGFLIALGAGQLGMDAKYSVQPKPVSKPPVMKNGKPLLPIEHKVLHLHLAKRMTVATVIARSITHHKHKWHEVRSHWRTLKNKDGTVKARVPVKSHERGDERLGRVEKTYKVER